jgi:uncharacterized protein YdeI (YjbR/CyaY-like superfamily)
LKPKFFRTPADFRTWLEKNHATATELWVGFYKRDSRKPSITWPESVDEALCFGWIDGIRKRVDEICYKIRFTPRRRGSIWSATNVKRAKALAKQRRMRPAGLKAFAVRAENKSGIYSYEQRKTDLEEPYAKHLKKNKAAWNFFQMQPPSYRKMIGWWIVSAKKQETRMARLAKLASESVKGKRLFQSDQSLPKSSSSTPRRSLQPLKIPRQTHLAFSRSNNWPNLRQKEEEIRRLGGTRLTTNQTRYLSAARE